MINKATSSPSKTSGGGRDPAGREGQEERGKGFELQHSHHMNYMNGKRHRPQTVLLCPCVQLLPQVHYLDAEPLLAVRPLQVRLWSGHTHCMVQTGDAWTRLLVKL